MVHSHPLSEDERHERARTAEARIAVALAAQAGSLARLARQVEAAGLAVADAATELQRATARLEGLLPPALLDRYQTLRSLGIAPLEALAALDQSDDAVAAALVDAAAYVPASGSSLANSASRVSMAVFNL